MLGLSQFKKKLAWGYDAKLTHFQTKGIMIGLHCSMQVCWLPLSQSTGHVQPPTPSTPSIPFIPRLPSLPILSHCPSCLWRQGLYCRGGKSQDSHALEARQRMITDRPGVVQSRLTRSQEEDSSCLRRVEDLKSWGLDQSSRVTSAWRTEGRNRRTWWKVCQKAECVFFKNITDLCLRRWWLNISLREWVSNLFFLYLS